MDSDSIAKRINAFCEATEKAVRSFQEFSEVARKWFPEPEEGIDDLQSSISFRFLTS
jgi:uncharacterized protein (DUF2384 family)